MPTLADAVNQLVQISRQGFADTRHLLENVFRVQMGLNPNVMPIPQALPAGGSSGGGGGGAAGRGGGGGGGQGVGAFLGLLGRRFAPRFSSNIGFGIQLARTIGGASAAAAGGGAAAGAGAGAGAAASGAAAGAAALGISNPVGWAVLAVAAISAVAVAMASLPKLIFDFAQSMLDSQRKLAQVSAPLAAVMARNDVRDMIRNVQIGARVAPQADRLARALGDLKDRNVDLIVAWETFKLKMAEFGVKFLIPLMDGIKLLISLLPGGKDALEALAGPEVPVASLQDHLGLLTRAWAEDRARFNPLFERNPFVR